MGLSLVRLALELGGGAGAFLLGYVVGRWHERRQHAAETPNA
jgi:hypothetical protein